MRPSNQRKLLEGVHDQEPVSGFTHNFYRYPARFSPAFARAVIEAFTKPGDLVYDPFMGGGTSLVESTVLGRAAVGTDISSLAVFVSRVKTMPMTSRGLEQIQIWAESVIPYLNVGTPAARASDWAELGYHKNISSRSTWRIRKLLEVAIAKAAILAKVREQEFARCILLRTAQWALDCRSDIPTPRDFREQFTLNSDEMIRGAYEYARAVHAAPQRQRPVCLDVRGRHRSGTKVSPRPSGLSCFNLTALSRSSRSLPSVANQRPKGNASSILDCQHDRRSRCLFLHVWRSAPAGALWLL